MNKKDKNMIFELNKKTGCSLFNCKQSLIKAKEFGLDEEPTLRVAEKILKEEYNSLPVG